MKWFQCDSDSPGDPKIKAIIRRGLKTENWNGGQAAAGALWLLWCYVANHGAGLPGEGVDGDGLPLPLVEMADECLFDSVDDLKAFLNFLAEKRHIDPDKWDASGLVCLPAMASRADAYAKSKGRKVPQPVETLPGTSRPGENSPLQHNTRQDTTKKTAPLPSGSGELLLEPPAEGKPKPTAEDLQATWNQHRTKGPKVLQLDEKRIKAFLAALKDQPDLAKWAAVIQWIDKDPMANAPGTGQYPTWRLDLDFLVKPGNLQKRFERMQAALANPTSAASGRVAPTPGKFAAAAAKESDGGDGGQ